jgi:Kinesin motor domain
MIEDVVRGINVGIFAYGSTGSGKTYSIFGKEAVDGLIALLAFCLFELMKANPDMRYNVTCSQSEVYPEGRLEKVRDLLQATTPELDIREDKSKLCFCMWATVLSALVPYRRRSFL